MEIPIDHPLLMVLVDPDCLECDHTLQVSERLVRSNVRTGVELRTVDIWEEPDAAVAAEALGHPTALLFVNGHERARQAGSASERRTLRRFLPYLYPDPDEALVALRDQTGNAHDRFSRPAGSTPGPDVIALLSAVPLFRNVSRRNLAKIARFTDETHVDEGDVIARQGAPGDELHVLVAGTVTVERDGVEIARLGAGEVIGEMSIIDGDVRSATVTALSACELLSIHRRDFDHLLDRIPELARDLLVTVTERLRGADRRIVTS